MQEKLNQDEKIARMTLAQVYPFYIAKIEKKGRTEDELLEVIGWLSGFSKKEILEKIDANLNFTDFFHTAILHPKSKLITGSICGIKVQDIQNPLTQKVRYLDKLVDELAKGKPLDKIRR